MEKVKKKMIIKMVVGILLPTFMFLGVFGIVFGAVFNILPLLICGITCVVAGFYGTPVIWVSFNETVKQKRLVFAIVKEKIYTVQKLALHLQVSESYINALLIKCIQNGYLIGYIRDGDRIYKNANMNEDKFSYSVKCNYCGATFNYFSDETPICPYCSMSAKTNNNN